MFAAFRGVFSDTANKAIAAAKPQIFQPDWKKVFEPAAIQQTIDEITRQDTGK